MTQDDDIHLGSTTGRDLFQTTGKIDTGSFTPVKDTHIEGLGEIVERVAGTFPDTGFFGITKFVQKLLADPAILAHIPAVKALQEEVDRLLVKDKLTCDALDECASTERRLTQRIATLEATNAAQAERIGELVDKYSDAADKCAELRALLQSSTPAESQLAGGEAVAWQVRFYHTDNGDPGWSSWQDCTKQEFILYGGYTAPKSEVRALYTAAPAIKQQVAEEAPTVAWLIEDYDCYGKQKLSVVLNPLTDDVYLPDTAEAFALCKKDSTPTQPVSANQPVVGEVPESCWEQAVREVFAGDQYGLSMVHIIENRAKRLAPYAQIAEGDK